MSSGEFDLIDQLFRKHSGRRKPFTRLGIGDDASLHAPNEGRELVVSTDSSVAGIHWPLDFSLDLAADKAVCAALSDLAAMGAEPLCAWLNVMAADRLSLEMMGTGATAALRRYDVELAGGDTSRSPTNAIAITVAGELPEGTAMRRDLAKAGDNLWLAGRTGVHALGLQDYMNGEKSGPFEQCFAAHRPLLASGVKLRHAGVRCCIDISDGLVQDAGHIAAASGLALELELTDLPGWHETCAIVGEARARDAMLRGGEDYALLFTAPAFMRFDVQPDPQLAVKIGVCRAGHGVRVTQGGEAIEIGEGGYDHFG